MAWFNRIKVSWIFNAENKAEKFYDENGYAKKNEELELYIANYFKETKDVKNGIIAELGNLSRNSIEVQSINGKITKKLQSLNFTTETLSLVRTQLSFIFDDIGKTYSEMDQSIGVIKNNISLYDSRIPYNLKSIKKKLK